MPRTGTHPDPFLPDDPARTDLVSRHGHDLHLIVEKLFGELSDHVDLLTTIGVLRDCLARHPDDPPERLEAAARTHLTGRPWTSSP